MLYVVYYVLLTCFLGVLGPNAYGISSDVPDGCTVDQAAYVVRHGSRYPDPGAYAQWVALYEKVGNSIGFRLFMEIFRYHYYKIFFFILLGGRPLELFGSWRVLLMDFWIASLL